MTNLIQILIINKAIGIAAAQVLACSLAHFEEAATLVLSALNHFIELLETTGIKLVWLEIDRVFYYGIAVNLNNLSSNRFQQVNRDSANCRDAALSTNHLCMLLTVGKIGVPVKRFDTALAHFTLNLEKVVP